MSVETCPEKSVQRQLTEKYVYVVKTYRLGSILSGFQTVGIYENPEVAVMVADDEYYDRDQLVGCIVEAFKLNYYYGVKKGEVIYKIGGETKHTKRV